MSVGLVALLDDVAAIAKVAAASLDDVAGQAAKAGVKAAGVVIDDAAVTPRYVTGFPADREVHVVARIALGSVRNKLLFLLPAALLLSAFAPWAITPLLMVGGLYLCYEGAEKVYEALIPDQAHAHEAKLVPVALGPRSAEDERVASAVKTDFILSAEIMAITLAALPRGSVWGQAAVLAIVGVGITAAVYGGVALIVKADDAGVAMARTAFAGPFGKATRAFGRALVLGMPLFLKALGIVGTAAMIWVGGGIVVHGLELHGLASPAHIIHGAAEAAGHALPSFAGAARWMVNAAASGLFGLALGAATIPFVSSVLAPAWAMVTGARKQA